ncbi:hypothetical protein [Enterococcus sp. DIV0802b]|uniref:hypothetical protein n=1 Tax=Enterococcus sp. DIV0802b TaxID=2774704 RepID=UPI003D2FBF66
MVGGRSSGLIRCCGIIGALFFGWWIHYVEKAYYDRDKSKVTQSSSKLYHCF